jgi:hypothetical protein
MCGTGSVTPWICWLQAGEQAAFQKLWERYVRRLVGLARKRLQGAPRSAADEEEVVLSAFDSFFRRAQEGHFPKRLDRNDLWQLLVLIAGRRRRTWPSTSAGSDGAAAGCITPLPYLEETALGEVFSSRT